MSANGSHPSAPPKQGAPITQPRSSFTISIELDALMDYMTMLRGMTAYGKFYDNFTSDMLTRFPAFGIRKSEWQLPDGILFPQFFETAVESHNFFGRVRPYDFATRDLRFLRRQGVEINVYIPQSWETYNDDIERWVEKFFPTTTYEKTIGFLHGDLLDLDVDSDAWVVRSLPLAGELAFKKQPFVLLDGKENKSAQAGIRAIRWDQAGYLVRHAYWISVEKDHSHLADTIAPAENIWNGHPVIAPDQNNALVWIGDQKNSLLRVLQDPDSYLVHKDRGKAKTTRRLDEEQTRRALTSIEADLQEIARKINVATVIAAKRNNHLVENPHWSAIVLEREQEMSTALAHIEKELGIYPVSGNGRRITGPRKHETVPEVNLAELLKDGDVLVGMEGVITSLNLINLISKYWEDFTREDLSHLLEHRSGELAEIITVLMLRNDGWTLLLPSNRNCANGKHSTLKDFTRIQVKWRDGKDPTEVDCMAISPDGTLYIFEVKVSSLKQLSKEQKELKKHLTRGGTIETPDCVGLRVNTPRIHANYRVLSFDQPHPQRTAMPNRHTWGR